MTTATPQGNDQTDGKMPAVRLVPMPPSVAGEPPEAGIADRLKYARSELSLSVEALARLTKRYDPQEGKGVSPSSLLRYESSESLPGARELRMLGEALAVPPQWLLLGQIPNAGRSAAQQLLLASLATYIRETENDIQLGDVRLSEAQQRGDELKRAEWLIESRKPGAT